MDEPIDAASAAVVLELEADLILFRCALPRRDASEHPGLWSKRIKQLWFKIFQMSTWHVRTNSDVSSMPAPLEQELRQMTSAREAAICLLASAVIASSDEADGREIEVERQRRNVRRYLETAEGREHKARVNHSLAGDLRTAGLKVNSLE